MVEPEDIEKLARLEAACILCKQDNNLSCKRCSKADKMDAVFATLNLYERLVVDDRAKEIAMANYYLQHGEHGMHDKDYVNRIEHWIVGLIIGFILLLYIIWRF